MGKIAPLCMNFDEQKIKSSELKEGVWWINSLAPGGFDYSLRLVNFKPISMINILSISCEIVIRWIPHHTDY